MPNLFCFNITQILQHHSKNFPTHNFYQQTCQGSQRSKRDSLITSSRISQQLLHTHFLIPQTRITKHIKVQPKLASACFELCSILEQHFSYYQSELETTITHISCFKNETPSREFIALKNEYVKCLFYEGKYSQISKQSAEHSWRKHYCCVMCQQLSQNDSPKLDFIKF